MMQPSRKRCGRLYAIVVGLHQRTHHSKGPRTEGDHHGVVLVHDVVACATARRVTQREQLLKGRAHECNAVYASLRASRPPTNGNSALRTEKRYCFRKRASRCYGTTNAAIGNRGRIKLTVEHVVSLVRAVARQHPAVADARIGGERKGAGGWASALQLATGGSDYNNDNNMMCYSILTQTKC
jgi:hypothetical protein